MGGVMYIVNLAYRQVIKLNNTFINEESIVITNNNVGYFHCEKCVLLSNCSNILDKK